MTISNNDQTIQVMPPRSGFKVVSLVNDKIMSFCYCLGIEYKENEWTQANIGQLFFFDELIWAKNFVRHPYNDNDRVKIYECEIEGNVRKPTFAIDWSFYMENDVPDMLKRFWNDIFGVYKVEPPRGTWVADRIRLIKKIDL